MMGLVRNACASSAAHEPNMVQGEALLEGEACSSRPKAAPQAERSLHVAISLSLMARLDGEGNKVHEFQYVALEGDLTWASCCMGGKQMVKMKDLTPDIKLWY